MNTKIVLSALLLSFCAMPALAQVVEEHTATVVEKDSGGTVPGVVSGAVAGAVVAGPVGAVVGAVVGGSIGHSVAPPTEVRTYVTTQDVPRAHYGDKFVVGHTIDGDVVWREVPSSPRYRWAYINDQRVVIDNDSRTVVAIY